MNSGQWLILLYPILFGWAWYDSNKSQKKIAKVLQTGKRPDGFIHSANCASWEKNHWFIFYTKRIYIPYQRYVNRKKIK